MASGARAREVSSSISSVGFNLFVVGEVGLAGSFPMRPYHSLKMTNTAPTIMANPTR